MYLCWLSVTQPAYLSTDKHTWLSIQVDWPTNIPVNRSWLTDQCTNQPIYQGWLTNHHTSLSIQLDWPTINHPIHQGSLTNQHTWLSIWVDWLTNIPAYLSGSTDHRTYQPIHPDWLIDQHTSLSKPDNLFGWLVVLRLNVPVNNFSVISGRSHRFLGN